MDNKKNQINKNQDQNNLYKSKYWLVFYDKTDEEQLFMFRNAKEILQFQKKPVNQKEIKKMNITIYNVLRKGIENNFCRFLNGEVMRLYLIDITDED